MSYRNYILRGTLETIWFLRCKEESVGRGTGAFWFYRGICLVTMTLNGLLGSDLVGGVAPLAFRGSWCCRNGYSILL